MSLENPEKQQPIVFNLEDVPIGDYLLGDSLILNTKGGGVVIIEQNTSITVVSRMVKPKTTHGLEAPLRVKIPGIGELHLRQRDVPSISLIPQ